MTVSVVIPTWNRSALLELAIRSALAQTTPPLEVLVCDDGSTDDTEQVVCSINDPRVIWLPGKHSGRPAIPRNRGIRGSSGEWVAFLDDDDIWLPEKLAVQLELLQRLNCRAVCSHALRTDFVKGADVYKLGWHDELLTFSDLLHGNRVICSSAVIHRSVLNRVEGFPESIRLKSIEDYAFWLRVATVTNFAFVSEPMLIYTDSHLTSLRSACTDALQQKRMVFRNFLAWGCRKMITADYLRSALYGYGEALLFLARKKLARYRKRLSRNKRFV
jgi:glycosyltransferase involved in cell wall biosynthesis